MKLDFTPVRSDTPVDIAVKGDILVVNDTEFDFTDLPDNSRLAAQHVACAILASDVVRRNGQIELTLIWPYAAGGAPDGPLKTQIIDDGPVSLEEVHP